MLIILHEYTVDRSQEVDTLPATHLTMLNRSPSFIVKLYVMLSQPELSDIITWLPHGRSWTIIDPIGKWNESHLLHETRDYMGV